MAKREKDIENYTVKRLRTIGISCYKWVSPGNIGVPDRICIGICPNIFFIEFKQLNEPLMPWQLRRCNELEALGYKVWIIDSYAKADQLYDYYYSPGI